MTTTFLTADTHFGHAGVCRFLRDDGTKLRPWDDPTAMDEAMIERWNQTVGPKDKVYVLGDVVINRHCLSTLYRLNGDKVLIRGNHDIFHLGEYTRFFRDVRACHVLDGMIMTHIPVHEDSLARFGVNIHGHLHYRRVMKPRGIDVKTGKILYSNEIDPRYHCVSVEHTDYAPIALEVVKERILQEGGMIGFRPKDMSCAD